MNLKVYIKWLFNNSFHSLSYLNLNCLANLYDLEKNQCLMLYWETILQPVMTPETMKSHKLFVVCKIRSWNLLMTYFFVELHTSKCTFFYKQLTCMSGRDLEVCIGFSSEFWFVEIEVGILKTKKIKYLITLSKNKKWIHIWSQ